MIIILTTILGALFWTLMEYTLHRFLGHEWKFKNKFRKEHQKHHHVKNYFAGAIDKILTSVVFGGLTFIITLYLFNYLIAIAFTFGFISMYMCYEYVHRQLHVKAPTTNYGKRLRAHHFHHHFNNEMANQGVTTIFWDKLFGTFETTEQIGINEKFIMPWLITSSGEIKPEYAKAYKIVTKTKFT